MSVPRVCFIVNPTAGHGRALNTWKRIEPLVRSLGSYGVKFTGHPRHGEELARQAAAEGYERVVALGGDGTLNEVGNGLIGTRAAMAVVPTGTGNDWVRTVGIPLNPEAAVRMAFQGRVRKSDVGLAEGHRHFFNVAGIGFDAEVSRRLHEHGSLMKIAGGTTSYLIALAATLARFGGVDVTAEIDGQILEIPAMILMAVGITRYYGGGMMILPDAEVDDGMFEVAWGEGLSRLELIRLVGKIYKGGHVGHPKVHFRRAVAIHARSAQTVAFHLDGDVVGNLPVTFRLLPGALDIVIPADRK